MKLFLCLLVFIAFLPVAQAKDKASTINREFTVKTLTLDMKDINDVGLVFVSNTDDGKLLLAGQAEYGLSLTGLAGKGEVDLTPFLKGNENFVVFVLWNKPGKTIDTKYYKKTLMNKWGYEIALYGDGTNLFRQFDTGEGNIGVVYYFAINIDKNYSGFEVSGATSKQLAKLTGIVSDFNNGLQTNPAPENNADIAAMLSVALTGG